MAKVEEATSNGLVDMTGNIANNVTNAVDSLSNMRPTDIVALLQKGVDNNLEVMIDSFTKSLIHFSVNIVISIIVFIVGRWVINRLSVAIEIAIAKRSNVDRSVRMFVKSIINIVLNALLILTIIQIIGIDTTSLVAMVASAGLAIGMALSGTLQNFAGGVMILFLKPYKVGDYITTQNESGTVKDIKLFTSVLETPDRHTIFVPNSSIISSTIKNATFAGVRRVDWSVGISYGDSVETARAVIMEILEADERVLGIKNIDDNQQHIAPPMVGVKGLGNSSVDLTVRAWVEANNYWDVYFAIYEKIYTMLPQRGVSFPFPQVDLHIKNDENSVAITMTEKK